MNILLWLILGALAGWLASLIMKTEQGLLIGAVIAALGGLVGRPKDLVEAREV